MASEVVSVHPKHLYFRNELVTAHKALRRSLERIIELAPAVKEKDQKDFRVFCSAFIDFLHEHHKIEDTICFPLLAGPCGVEAELKRVDSEHAKLDELMHNLQDTIKMPVYDGHKLAAAATALKGVMYEHLSYEESVFVTEVIARADPSVIVEIRKRIDVLLKKANPFTVLPFLISNLTKEEANSMVFDTAPWLLKRVLFPLVFSRKYKKAWAFSSQPRANAGVTVAA